MASQEDGLTKAVVGRYAPSPTGRLPLGNARTALLSWWSARSRGGRYILRVEDLDTGRCRSEFEERIFEDLAWLGLDWDEGPRVGGPNGPYRQSQCSEIYAAEMTRLDTYRCFCTRREIREAVSAPHGATPVYPGTCAGGQPAGATKGRVPSFRVRVPELRLGLEDRYAGHYEQDLGREVGDFIVRRADGAFAYQLAVVVDDERMGVTEVVRGTDLLDSTPRQIFLQRALGYRTLSYAHAPLVLGPDGVKLNKRHRAPDLGQLRESGIDPRLVVTALAKSVGLLPLETQERLTAGEVTAHYDERAITASKGSLGLEIDESWLSGSA